MSASPLRRILELRPTEEPPRTARRPRIQILREVAARACSQREHRRESAIPSLRLLPEHTGTAPDAHEPLASRSLFDLLDAAGCETPGVGEHVERRITVLSCRIHDLASLSEALGVEGTFGFVSRFIELMTPIVRRHGGVVARFLGSGFVALFPDRADDAVGAARDMLRELEDLDDRLRHEGRPPVRVGLGMHTGLAVLGLLGDAACPEVTVIGEAVDAASRIESLTRAYGTATLVTEDTLAELCAPGESGLRLVDRVDIPGDPRPRSVYELLVEGTGENE